MARRISIFGSTGSIGCNTVDLIERQGGAEAFDVVALSGSSNIALLAQQAIALRAEIAVTADPARLDDLRTALAGSGVAAGAGTQALLDAADRPVDWTMAAIVGAAGLAPTLRAARHGTTLALANKESLVCAGDLLLAECARHGTRLLPVDSEHSAIFQAMCGERRDHVDRVILTASGGPFRDWPLDRMRAATLAQAVAHPNWDMGQRISIDSASMFNKALEVIEAKYLFDLHPDQIEVLVHPQSIVHSMVGYADGSVMAQLGPPDMRGAIGYALNWPERAALPVERLDLATIARLDFATPDEDRFPALRLAREALEAGGLSGAILNGAKEAAMDAFIAGEIGFLAMGDLVEKALAALAPGTTGPYVLDDVLAVDAAARGFVAGALNTATRETV